MLPGRNCPLKGFGGPILCLGRDAGLQGVSPVHPNPTALLTFPEHHSGPGVGDVEGAWSGLQWAVRLR